MDNIDPRLLMALGVLASVIVWFANIILQRTKNVKLSKLFSTLVVAAIAIVFAYLQNPFTPGDFSDSASWSLWFNEAMGLVGFATIIYNIVIDKVNKLLVGQG